MTPQDIVIGALRLLRIVGAGETPSTSELNDGFDLLNQMLASWSNERLTVPEEKHQTFVLQLNKRDYTMGPGGDFPTATRVMSVYAAATAYGSFRQGMQVGPFEAIAQTSSPQGTTAALPDKLGVDNSFPLLNLQVHPTPNALSTIELHFWSPIAQFGALSDVLNLPEGFSRALRTNLAVDLAPEYGRTAPPELIAAAGQSKQQIQQADPMAQAQQAAASMQAAQQQQA